MCNTIAVVIRGRAPSSSGWHHVNTFYSVCRRVLVNWGILFGLLGRSRAQCHQKNENAASPQLRHLCGLHRNWNASENCYRARDPTSRTSWSQQVRLNITVSRKFSLVMHIHPSKILIVMFYWHCNWRETENIVPKISTLTKTSWRGCSQRQKYAGHLLGNTPDCKSNRIPCEARYDTFKRLPRICLRWCSGRVEAWWWVELLALYVVRVHRGFEMEFRSIVRKPCTSCRLDFL